ncbi:hypothetical protein PC116_g4771 [Phytophthora cactorum]|nr:hypothetical protein PC116_g4771 [Phytophthora cactorum]
MTTEEILFSLAHTFYPLEHHTKRALTSEDSGSRSGDVAPKKRKKKGRMPSHVAKREEKKHLLKELAFLEARAALLRQNAGIPDPKEVAASEHQVEVNRQLKEAIQVQQNAMAVAQSAFAEFSTLRGHNPLESYILLGKDTAARRSQVCALKFQYLQRAKQFLRQRMELVTNSNRPFHEESGYLTEEGHYIATKLDVHQFVGVQSVKQVFDALEFYFFNLEITTTELGEDLTVREDSNDLDSNSDPMLHHRLVTMLSNGPMVEKNAIKFFQFYEHDENGDGPYGIMAAAPIDEDDLYPSPKAKSKQEVQQSVTHFTDHMVHSMNQSLFGAS